MMSGSVLVLEAETAAGKTEAAISHFKNLKAAGLVDSFFFGLPTRTSAAQIHRRIGVYVSRILNPAPVVTLAVPGYLVDNPADCLLPVDNDIFDGEHEDRDWFSKNSNRYLASTAAVGTVDQILLSVTRKKHASMRWSSMARSLLIIDEVHASDVFMSKMLEVVVAKHVRRGGHVLLMSATLGSSQLHDFLKSAGITTHKRLSFDEACNIAYPVIHSAKDGEYRTTPIKASGSSKTVEVSIFRSIDDDDAVVARVAAHARAGARVLVIRNTVSACVRLQKALEAILPPEIFIQVNGIAVPHHGRYAPEDRFLLDGAIEAGFGKNSPDGPKVAICTQTVEQSLDIDADVLITDICPMDVLLQRIGRLHRHRALRTRPTGYEIARAEILVPISGLEAYAVKSANSIGRGRAYENVLAVILTAEELERRKTLTIPDENRFLVECSTHPDVLERRAANSPALSKYHFRYLGTQLGAKTIARSNARDPDWRYGDAVTDDWGTGTSRLGELGMRVNFPSLIKTSLGSMISGLAIPAWILQKNENNLDIELDDVISSPNGVTFSIGDHLVSYGKYGMEF